MVRLQQTVVGEFVHHQRPFHRFFLVHSMFSMKGISNKGGNGDEDSHHAHLHHSQHAHLHHSQHHYNCSHFTQSLTEFQGRLFLFVCLFVCLQTNFEIRFACFVFPAPFPNLSGRETTRLFFSFFVRKQM